MAGRPAPLDGSLLARKGDAHPVIPDDSPLMDSVEDATSDVVPLHRVEPAGPPPAQTVVVPSVIHNAPSVSPRRRAAVILIGLLVLGLIAVALAFRGEGVRRAGTGAAGDPAPERAVAGPAHDPVPAPAATAAAPPQETQAPPPAAAAGPPPDAPATPPPEPAAAAVAPPPDLPPPAAAPPQVPVTAAPQPAAPPAPVSAAAPYILQFASVRGERRAREEAARLQQRLGGILGDRKIVVVGTEVRGRTRYRLRAGGFDSLRTAISACREVARLKVECLPIRR